MRQNVDLAIYTPGSNAGVPVSVLQSFAAPSPALLNDTEMYRDRVQANATSILSLLRIDTHPVSSREHILISRLLDHAWQQGRDLGVASLIANPSSKKLLLTLLKQVSRIQRCWRIDRNSAVSVRHRCFERAIIAP